MVTLTIGMATYNDFDGVYFTLQALRWFQDLDDTEVVVIDNYGCEHTRSYVEGWSAARYIRAMEVVGTAAPRDLIFHEARGEAVLCCDSHVLFAPGTIARLKAYYQEHPDTVDLLQGPLLYDDLQSVSTHFDPVWWEEIWGTWATDPRGLDPEAEPFEIPMQGLGVFSCRKAAWPGFNPAFRGFGGEEGYLHEKVRQRGGRTLCLPWLRWVHRFGRPRGVPYPLLLNDKVKNYIIGHTELGLDLTPIKEHFSSRLSGEEFDALVAEALAGNEAAGSVHAAPPTLPNVVFASSHALRELSMHPPPTGEMPLTWHGKPAIWMAWTGDNAMPDILSLCLASVRRHNSADFEVIVVTPENLRDFVDPHPAYPALSLNHRADYLRCWLLHHHGGMYLDMDTIGLRSLAGVYADLANHDLVNYDGAPWGEVFGVGVFGPTRRGSLLTHGWIQAVEDLLNHRHGDLVAYRRSHADLGVDCLGWSELCRDQVQPVARRLADAGQLSVRLLEPTWAHYAAGGPAYDELFQNSSPQIPETELLILNHAMFPAGVRSLTTDEIARSALGICRLIQRALGWPVLGAPPLPPVADIPLNGDAR